MQVIITEHENIASHEHVRLCRDSFLARPTAKQFRMALFLAYQINLRIKMVLVS